MFISSQGPIYSKTSRLVAKLAITREVTGSNKKIPQPQKTRDCGIIFVAVRNFLKRL